MRKISNLGSPSQRSSPASRLARSTKTLSTPQVSKGILIQSPAGDEEDPHRRAGSSRTLRRKVRISETNPRSHSASLKSLPVGERVDNRKSDTSQRSAEHGNRTPTPDSESETGEDQLQYNDDGLQATPSKTTKSKPRVEYSSPGKDRLSPRRKADAKNARVSSENGKLSKFDPGRYSEAENEDPGVSEGNRKVPIKSKRILKEKQKGSKNISKANSITVVEPDARNIEQLPGSGARARRKPRSDSLNRIQTTNPVLPSTPTSGKKRGRPRKVVGDAAADPQQHGDPLGSEIATDQINALGREQEEGSRHRPTKPSNATLRNTTQKHPQSQYPDFQSPSERNHLESSISHALDPNIQQSLDIVGSKLQALMAEDTSDCLTELKTRILEGLTGKQRLPLIYLEQEYQKVHQLLEQTVLAGEGNSMLVIGSRGTGKTTLVETAITDLTFSHQDKFHVIRLNGFIQTDDKLALREIWRQLGREIEAEDETTGQRSNYADTLTSLLALLSHSAEATDPELQDHTAKSVIFIIDEFDLFASHPRQTLLYNLFDVAQSRNAPIAVLGLTTKIDVVESLEKRVKSRFGQRSVYLSPPRTFTAFQAICKAALVPQSPSSGGTFAHRLAHTTNTDTNIKTLLLSAWSAYIDALFEQDPIFQTFLRRIYTLSKSIPTFLTAFLLPISLLSPSHPLPTGPSFTSTPLSTPDSKLSLLKGLSTLSLSLLIAAARLDIVLASDLCTFAMAYEEYVAMVTRAKISSSAATAGHLAPGAGVRLWGREIASAAWERLVQLELLVPAIGGGSAAGVGVGAGGVTKGEGSRMWRVDVSLEEIGPGVQGEGLGGVMARWCREI